MTARMVVVGPMGTVNYAPATAAMFGQTSFSEKYPRVITRRRYARRSGRARVTSATLALAVTVVFVRCRSDSTVSDPPVIPASITVNGPGNTVLNAGQTYEMRVSAFDARGHGIPAPPVTWTSSEPRVATIATTGVLTAVGAGTTTIRASTAKLSATASVAVRVLAVSVLPQGEFGDTIQLAPGQTLQLSAYEYDRNNFSRIVEPDAGSQPVWASDSPDVATVTSSGLVTAVAEGRARMGVSFGSLTGYRPIRVAQISGSVTVRFVNAVGDLDALTLRSNTAEPVSQLRFGEVREQTVPAGTLFVTVDGFPPSSPPWCRDCLDGAPPTQEFIGFLRANTRATLVATSSLVGFALAPLWDWNGPVAADSAMVRVLLAATDGGFNVYFVDPGAPMGVLFLRGCYLDWPYGVTAYSARPAKPFDIVLQYGKGVTGPESARFTVTPEAGRATTYILAGQSTETLRVITLVDR